MGISLINHIRTFNAAVCCTLCTAVGRGHCDKSYYNQGLFSGVIRRPENHGFVQSISVSGKDFFVGQE